MIQDNSTQGQSDLERAVDQEYFFGDPLSLIEPEADLDAVLKSKSIGETMQLLCPRVLQYANYPRMKYRKRGALNDNEKQKLVREQNRENARRTRKRRRLLDAFLSYTLEALEGILHPMDRTISKSSISVAVDSNNITQCKNVSDGLRLLREYVRMKCTHQPRVENWSSICDENVQFIVSFQQPNYSNALLLNNEKFEFHGLEGIICDIEKRNNFLNALFSHRPWVVEGELWVLDTAIDKNHGSFRYECRIYETDTVQKLPVDFLSASIQRERSVVIRSLFTCKVRFGSDGRIDLVHEDFDMNDFMSQAKQVSMRSRYRTPSSVGPFPSPLTTGQNEKDTIKRFLALYVSKRQVVQDWLAVCSPNVVHILTLPENLQLMFPNSVTMTRYKTQGVEELVRFVEDRSSVISSMLQSGVRHKCLRNLQRSLPVEISAMECDDVRGSVRVECANGWTGELFFCEDGRVRACYETPSLLEESELVTVGPGVGMSSGGSFSGARYPVLPSSSLHMTASDRSCDAASRQTPSTDPSSSSNRDNAVPVKSDLQDLRAAAAENPLLQHSASATSGFSPVAGFPSSSGTDLGWQQQFSYGQGAPSLLGGASLYGNMIAGLAPWTSWSPLAIPPGIGSYYDSSSPYSLPRIPSAVSTGRGFSGSSRAYSVSPARDATIGSSCYVHRSGHNQLFLNNTYITSSSPRPDSLPPPVGTDIYSLQASSAGAAPNYPSQQFQSF